MSRAESLNAALLLPEEMEMEFGLGYRVAANRLDLIYLADVVAIAHVVARSVELARKLQHDFERDLLSGPQFGKAEDELINQFAAILRGENPRYMAPPWFTDPDQLASHIFNLHEPAYRDDPQAISQLTADPIREAALLIITFANEPSFFDDLTVEEFVVSSARELLNIPECVPLEMLEVTTTTSLSIDVRRRS